MKQRKNMIYLNVFSSVIFLITVIFSIIININLFNSIQSEEIIILLTTIVPISICSLIIGSVINLINSIIISKIGYKNQIWFSWILCIIEIILIGVQFLILYLV